MMCNYDCVTFLQRDRKEWNNSRPTLLTAHCNVYTADYFLKIVYSTEFSYDFGMICGLDLLFSLIHPLMILCMHMQNNDETTVQL